MQILITGGAGFIGSHLCDRLIEAGHSIVAVDDLSLGRTSNLAHLSGRPDFRFEELSILDPAFDTLVGDSRFEAVFHLAANSDIQAGTIDRRVDLDKTFLTTWHVCEAMARHDVHQLIFASTSAIYGDVAEATNENHGPLIPISFYGAAKLASEAFCSAYAHRHDIRTWMFRFPNVVGSRATHGVILDFMKKLEQDPSRLEVLGDGSQEKPYLYVHDLLDAILLAWERVQAEPLEVFNIGPKSATRVRTIAETVVAAKGLAGTAEIQYGEGGRGWPGDVPRFSYDLSKIHGIGWKTNNTSDEAMRRAVEDLLAERSKG